MFGRRLGSSYYPLNPRPLPLGSYEESCLRKPRRLQRGPGIDDCRRSRRNQGDTRVFANVRHSLRRRSAVSADTGATHSVAGEKLYHLLMQKGLNFEEEKTSQMTPAYGRTQTT
ncbi:hypothetical protein TNCV_802241 [Trichonephila clavipes]|nr:hypothetical protein TNCV_802241 [Trichonephila clavipes]